MATLAEQRRAISAGISRARAATAGAERQAIHDNMVAKRTGRNIQSDLNALAPSPRKQAGLRKLEQKGARPATRSPALNTPQPTRQSAGIASPLTEADYATREYHATRYEMTADGIYLREVKPIEKIVMADANDAEVPLIFAEPT